MSEFDGTIESLPDDLVESGKGAGQAVILTNGTHHITIVAAYATVATGNIVVGTLAGVLASVLGTQLENVFNKYNDTHIDSPAFTIALGSFIVFNFIG